MKQGRFLLKSFAKIEGLPVAAVLAVLYAVLIVSAPTCLYRIPDLYVFLADGPSCVGLCIGSHTGDHCR